MAKIQFPVTKRKGVLVAVLGALCIIAIIFVARFAFSTGRTVAMSGEDEYVLLAENSSGLRCIQKDYSVFMLLPPGNTIKVQVFQRGKNKARLVTQGITVHYEVLCNTESASKNNFWEYAQKYGYKVHPNEGITGNKLKGECVLSKDGKYYVAANIPVIPYNDGSSELNAYQLARVWATNDSSGLMIAQQPNVVLPVSDEMLCSSCHGNKNTNVTILKAHDEHSHTRLYGDYIKGILYKCSDCHQDNAVGAKGIPEAMPLSQAMHGFHADKMNLSKINPNCYNCHPGPTTQCYRGRMHAADISCADPKCHGDMAAIAKSQKEGRQAWRQEVDCAQCHDPKYAVNPGLLYMDSYLLNPPRQKMADLILCESCHNSPHAEWTSTLDADNSLAIGLQGYAGPIDKCSVCHNGKGTMHR